MRRRLSEKKVLKILEIPDFRHMTKEKVIKFASILPYMEGDVAKKALEQFPEFKELASELVAYYKDSVEKILKSNEDSVNAYYDGCAKILESLQKELDNPELNESERDRIEDKMILIAQMMGEKDTENKKFLLDIAKTLGAAVAFVAFTAAATLGINAQFKLPSYEDENDYEEN